MKEFELENGEMVVLQVRKHWFVFVLELLPYLIAAAVPFMLPNLLTLIPSSDQYPNYINLEGNLPDEKPRLFEMICEARKRNESEFRPFFIGTE